MRGLLRAIIANPVAVIILALLAGLGGMYAVTHLPVGLFPGLDVPVVNVISHYPGAAAEDMELLVTRPIEDRIRTIPGVRRVASTSTQDVSQITVEFDWGTRLSDARQLVQAEVSAVQRDLPQGVTPRLENIGTTLQEVAGYVVYGAGDPVNLRSTIHLDVASRLMGVQGVSRVEVLGGEEPAFIVTLSPDELERQHLTVNNVTAAIARQNLASVADYLERGSREYLIRGDARLKTIQDVQAVPVVSGGQRSVLLGQIASVREGRAPRHYEVRGNGVPAVAFTVSKQPDASTVRVVPDVDRQIQELKHLLPAGTEIRKFYDQSDIIIEARDSLWDNLLVGAALVVAVLYFFMGALRATLIVAGTIPLTLLATLAIMQVFGLTLNVVTLSALTLVVGMVVDDAIVVADSIFRHVQSGASAAQASVEGTAQIAAADASGTFTTVAVFLPLLVVGGIAGLFTRPFGFVISMALLVSLAASLSFVPVLFRWVGGKTPGARAVGSRTLEHINRSLQRALRFAFAHRPWVLSAAAASLALGGVAAWLGPVNVLPAIDEGALLIEYIMPPGTSLVESDRIGQILEGRALAEPDVSDVYRRTGSPEAGIQIEGVDKGELTIKLKPRSARTRTLAQVMANLRADYEKVPGIVCLYRQPTLEKMDESLQGLPAVFGVTVFGSESSELVSLAAQLEQIMVQDPALGNVVNNTKIKTPQILITPDPAELARCGLTSDDVFKTVKAARFGVEATTVVRQREQVHVLVKLESPPEPTVAWLKSLPVTTADGQVVPLSRLADVHIAHLPAAVTRLNGSRQVTVLAEVEGSIPAVVDRLRQKFAAVGLPAGYSIAFTGQYEVLQKTIMDFVLVSCAAAVLVYLIMVMQFRAWFQPLVILVTIPFSLVGAIIMLAVTRVGLDVSVGMGALTLIGIAVNNAIILLDYANRQVTAGRTIREALGEAVSVRLRPVLMTAATTIFALVPVAVNPAVGSRIFQPFAVTVIGGLLSATAATLLLVPTLATWSSTPTVTSAA